MRVSAKADYAVRAMLELTAASAEEPLKGDRVAEAQGIPLRFLENILAELRHHGLVNSKRGADGGYWLARDPTQISLAETIRAVEGPLASVRGEPAEEISYGGVAESLQDVWIALRGGVRTVLDSVSLADVASGELPADVVRLSAQWRR